MSNHSNEDQTYIIGVVSCAFFPKQRSIGRLQKIIRLEKTEKPVKVDARVIDLPVTVGNAVVRVNCHLAAVGNEYATPGNVFATVGNGVAMPISHLSTPGNNVAPPVNHEVTVGNDVSKVIRHYAKRANQFARLERRVATVGSDYATPVSHLAVVLGVHNPFMDFSRTRKAGYK